MTKSSAAFLVCSSIIMSLQIFLQRGYMSIVAHSGASINISK
nr:MAG TPA: hypothetical protein [Caudoviricetes sp.]DAZ55785.1 MAG TPA: hypothetical protein [Caudoviricetes sp.]